MTTLINTTTATSAELLAFFNANTGGAQVKKFADRKTAERRVGLLVAEMAEEGDSEGHELTGAEAAFVEAWVEVASAKVEFTPAEVATFSAEFSKELSRCEVLDAPINPAPAEVVPTPESPKGNCPECGSTEMYLGRAHNGRVIDEDHIVGCHNCSWEADSREPAVALGKTPAARPAMVASLKIDRRIVDTDTSIVYANACQVWKAGLVSASQGDRLSAVLYGAAKKGGRVVTVINGRTFRLFA